MRAQATQRGAAALFGAGLLLSACGGDSTAGDDGAVTDEISAGSTTTDPGLPSCRDVDRAVVFSVFGAATLGDGDEVAAWIDDSAEPTPRPGAAEVARAYRDLGYEILYITTLPSDTRIDDRPLVDAVTVWLGTNGFPVGDEARVWQPTGGGDPSVALIEELTRLGTRGVEFGAGYAGNPDTVFPLVTGGIPREWVFTVGEETTDGPPTSLLDEDLEPHVPDVQALDPVCE